MAADETQRHPASWTHAGICLSPVSRCYLHPYGRGPGAGQGAEPTPTRQPAEEGQPDDGIGRAAGWPVPACSRSGAERRTLTRLQPRKEAASREHGSDNYRRTSALHVKLAARLAMPPQPRPINLSPGIRCPPTGKLVNVVETRAAPLLAGRFNSSSSSTEYAHLVDVRRQHDSKSQL